MRLGTYYRTELLKNLHISTKPTDIVLDVGSYDAYWLSTQKAKEKHALDLNIKPTYKGIIYKKGDAKKLPYPDNYFDKSFAFDVIEHVENEKSFLSELIRVTKGKITLTTPSKYIRVFPFFLTGWVSKKWGHYKCRGYSPREILNFINHNYNVKIITLEGKYYLTLYFLLRFLWALIPSFVHPILKKISKKDASIIGKHGFLLIEITK